MQFPIYHDPSFQVTQAYKFGGTPQTIVVSREGKVLKNWIGAYGGSIKGEVESYLQLQLPGLVAPPAHN